MENRITNLEIKNFKSIKEAKFDCKRINVFIGEPNVGKSNILEALSLFVSPTCALDIPILKDYIRYEKTSNLFYDNDRKNTISVKTNIGVVYLRFHLNSINAYDITIGPDDNLPEIFKNSEAINLNEIIKTFDNYRDSIKDTTNRLPKVMPFYHSFREGENFTSAANYRNFDLSYSVAIKRYIFKSLSKLTSPYTLFLRPPYGDNLVSILESNPTLFDEVSAFFTNYGLDLLLDTVESSLSVQKRVKNRVYKVPFSLSADTLQRIIFHLAAIETNDKSILLFEEPEAHSYPPYISLLAEKMIESKNNQFFITTHSPYILTPFIEQCSHDDVAIFVCTYENYETKIKELSSEEVTNIMETGIDLFYNLPAFEHKK